VEDEEVAQPSIGSYHAHSFVGLPSQGVQADFAQEGKGADWIGLSGLEKAMEQGGDIGGGPFVDREVQRAEIGLGSHQLLPCALLVNGRHRQILLGLRAKNRGPLLVQEPPGIFSALVNEQLLDETTPDQLARLRGRHEKEVFAVTGMGGVAVHEIALCQAQRVR
jgi:hypothetical protein